MDNAIENFREEAPVPFHQLPTDRLVDLALHSTSAWARADALEELTTRRSEQALPACVNRLDDPDGDVRRVAAEGLAESGNRTGLAALEQALPGEAVERTRLAMAQAIVELRQELASTRAE
jgi:HEAT repeat protein